MEPLQAIAPGPAQAIVFSDGLNGALDESVEVCWPTSVAHGILRAALVDALADLARCDVAYAELDELGEALDAARACLATWSAFVAVDFGGLP
jgi:hypothetical protein